MVWSAKDFSPNFLKPARKNIGSLFVRTFSREDSFWMKKSFHVILHTLGANFLKSNNVGHHFCPDFQGFCKGFHRFYANLHRFFPDFQGFFPDFQHMETFGCALAPPAPHPPIPLMQQYSDC